MELVKIVSCRSDSLWYKDHIGEEFQVERIESKDKSREFKDAWKRIHGTKWIIHVDDMERVEK